MKKVQKLTTSALFLAMAMLLPFLTGQIPQIGNMLCPMHIPVLLCGFLCGWPRGAAVGLCAPLLRSVCFGAPVFFPGAVSMAAELACYGLLSGLLYKIFPKKIVFVYLSLLLAMIGGRLVWGTVQALLVGAEKFTLSVFIADGVAKAIPGIILQIILVPPLVVLLKRVQKSENQTA